MSAENFEIPTFVWEHIMRAFVDLFKGPLPPFSVLGIDVIIHDGRVQRIETKKEAKIAVPKEVV